MVGKAQRTKNNVKASNSGRSAQLLANLPNTSFIGFSTLKDVALHTTPDLFDDTISPDFQIILKKMNKKDSVTKHKALHEFADLCKSSDIDTLKSILPLWPRLYSILSIDIENRVREASQYAHKCIVTQVKRNIAPHLKHLIGPWIVSQFDTYPPAASVAKTSFEDVFPPLKRTEVFAFCKDDLFNYIIDNLIVQTPQTMSNPKITDAVNMEMKYERVISSTLQAYALFISKLPADTLESTLEDHTSNVLSTAKFWKYQKHESNLIRSSWYLLVATLIEKCPQVFVTDLKKLAVAIFSNLNEKDVKVNANVWDAALYCVLRYDSELWKCISVDKLVVPNVCSTLENGFHGNGSQIAPKLLPLLSKLPTNEVSNRLNIYDKVLSSLLLNITATSVKGSTHGQLSSSEFDAVLKCFTECCRYVLKTESTTPSSANLCIKVVLEYILPLYKTPASHIQFSLTIRYLYQLELEPTLTDTLWELMASKLLEANVESLEKELGLHASLVQCLWNPYSARKCVGGMRVKFQEEQDGNEGDASTGLSDMKNNLDSPCERFTAHIHSFISRLFENYLSQISSLTDPTSPKSFEKSYVLHICKLSSHLNSKLVYDLLPLPAAFNQWGLIAGDSMYELVCKYIARLDINQTESNKILEHVASNQTMPLFTWCLINLHKYGAIVHTWLQEERLQDTLLSIAYQVTLGSKSHTELLEKCFVPSTVNHRIGDQGSIENTENTRNTAFKNNEHCEVDRDSANTDSKLPKDNQSLAIIINASIADRIFLQFLDVFRHFGDNASEDKIDYENCAHVVSLFLRVETVASRHAEVIAELLVFFAKAIMKSGETRKMLLCWEAALACAQPDTFIRHEIWSTIHSLCVETLINLSTPKVETPFENEDPISDKQIIKKSVVLLFKLMVEPEMNWATIFRPSLEMESARVLWHVYVCMCKEDVYKCVGTHALPAVREWNLQDSVQVQTVYWNLHVYVRLVLSLLETLSQPESENLADFFLDYFLYTSFTEQYVPTLKTEDMEELFSRVWNCCEQGFIEKAGTLDVEKYGYLESIECVRGHLKKKEHHIDAGSVVASSDDLIKLVDNIVPSLQSPVTRESFIQYVRNHSKDQLVSRDDIVIATSLVQVFSKLMSLVNGRESESQCVESIVDTIRGEIMLSVTSQLVHYYTHITSSNSDSSDPCARIFLAAQLLRCYQQIDEYCRERTGTEFSVEWNSVFADDCKDVIANIWVWTASMESEPKSIANLLLLNILCSTLYSSHATFSTLDTLCPLLLAPSRAVQVTAFELIRRFDVIDSYDVIASTLTSAQTVVDAMLQNFSLGDTCIVLGATDSYTYCLGYLLTWSLIVHRCDMAESCCADVTDVALWLKTNGYVDALMRILLELMPESIVHGGACIQNVQHLFQSPAPSSISEDWTSSRLSELVCGVYFRVLRRFPALVRQWWNESCSPPESTLVEKLTSRYVSPLLCAEELRTAAKFTQENMQIRVFPGTKEVVATYTLEEASMEITITLPSNHPLGVIRVDSSKNLFPNTQWIKQITKFLIHANGSICDGLSSWKSNMDKKFDGVEECYICFCILHSRNHELPRKSCRTCQKKFHSYCLFKWFTTSNKSTCPICRNLF